MKLTTKKLIFAAMLTALMAVLEVLNLGIIYIPPVSATILHIPVIIGTLTAGLGVGLILGGAFGVISLVDAIVRPVLLSPLFYNPLVSIVPRLMIPVVTYGIYMLFKGFERKHPNLRVVFSAVAGSLTNTILVLSALVLFYGESIAAGFNLTLAGVAPWAFGVALANGIPEAALCAFLTWAIVKAISKTPQYKRLKGTDI